MASRADIEAGKAFVRLFLKDDMTGLLQKKLQGVGKTLKETGAQVAKIGAGISAAGASILAPLAGAVAHFVKVGDDLGDMAARTGVAAGALAELSYAAIQSGTDIDAVERSLIRMTRTIGDAAGGTKAARKALDDIGLSWKDLREIAPEDQFQAIADALADVDESMRLAKATKIFGKGAAEIMPMLADLRAFRDDARAEGIIPSEEAIEAAGKLDASFNKLKAVISSLVFEIGASLAEEVLAFAEIARDVIKTVRDWIKENSGLVKIVAAVGLVLAGAGALITAVGGAMIAAGLVATGFAAVIGAVSAAIAFLATPIGVVVLAIAAVTAALTASIVWWAKFTESGKAAVKIVRDVFGGIFDALKAGKWQLAGDIAMAALKLSWVIGTNELKQIWADAMFYIESIWHNTMDALSEAFFAVIDEIKDAWNTLFPDMPITGGGDPGTRKAAAEKRKQDRAQQKKNEDSDRDKAIAAAKKHLDDLIARSKLPDMAGVGGGGGGPVGGGGLSAPQTIADAISKQRKNMITTSAASAVSAGYQGGIHTMDRKEKDIERIIKKHLEQAEKDRVKLQRTLDRIAEGLVFR